MVVVHPDGAHHHVRREQFGLGEVDEHQREAEHHGPDELADRLHRRPGGHRNLVEDRLDAVERQVENADDGAGHGRPHQVHLPQPAAHLRLGVEQIEHGADELPAWEELLVQTEAVARGRHDGSLSGAIEHCGGTGQPSPVISAVRADLTLLGMVMHVDGSQLLLDGNEVRGVPVGSRRCAA